MAGQVAFVAEGGLAAVALVWLVAVDLTHVIFQRVFLRELGVTPVAEEVIFCQFKEKERENSLNLMTFSQQNNITV